MPANNLQPTDLELASKEARLVAQLERNAATLAGIDALLRDLEQRQNDLEQRSEAHLSAVAALVTQVKAQVQQ